MWRPGEAGNVPEELRPGWLRQQQAAQISGDQTGGASLSMRSWFPYDELQGAFSGVFKPDETARWLATGVRPGMKFIYEMATLSDSYRQQPVKPFTMAEMVGMAPKAVVGASGTPLDNLLAIRPLREALVRIPAQEGVGSKALRFVAGGIMQPLSAERGLGELDVQTAKTIAEIRSRLKRAQDKGDLATVAELLRQLVMVQRERMRLGLAVPRATTTQFGQAGIAPPPSYPNLTPAAMGVQR